MTHINWLHLSDLRMGVSGSELLESEVREELERDLRALHAEAGPWDAVLLTGDLTLRGDWREFEQLESFLDALLGNLAELGSNPVLLAVPGKRDVHWRWSLLVDGREDQRVLSRELPAELHAALMAGFRPFSEWYDTRRPASARRSRVPGDIAHSLVRDRQSLDVLGLNSAAVQLGVAADWKGRLEVDTLFAQQAFPINSERPLLIVSQHAPDWLREDVRADLDELARRRPTLHLVANALERGSSSAAPLVQALSLFGREGGFAGIGYCAGRVDFDAECFRLWPRVFSRSRTNRLVASPDRRFLLGPNESLVFPWKARPKAILAVPSRVAERSVRIVPPDESPRPALGLSLRQSLGAGKEPAVWPAWSPDGSLLASGHADGTVVLWDLKTGAARWSAKVHENAVLDVAWSSDGKLFATTSVDCVLIWEPERHDKPIWVRGDVVHGGYALAWQPGGRMLAWRSTSNMVWLWSVTAGRSNPLGMGRALAFAWSPDGSHIATADDRLGEIDIWDGVARRRTRKLKGIPSPIVDFAWMPDSIGLAAAYESGNVMAWVIFGEHVLDAHTDAVTSLSFSHDGRLLATKSRDGKVKLWCTDTWDTVATIDEATSRELYGGLSFSPVAPALATLGSWNLRIWDLDIDALLRGASAAPRTIHSVSAKVVLVGEGSAGKSCLALRLAEDRYEDLGATHGMRFWSLPASKLEPGSPAKATDEREVVLWDLGGQSEYGLVHQLFLGDTTTALMVMDPRRGQAALDEIEAWDKRLEKHHAKRPIQKILVGTKLDDENAPADRANIEKLVRRLGFSAYVPTSAKEGLGIDALKQAISRTIAWSELGRTSQPELFRDIRRLIEAEIAAGRVVLLLGELDRMLREKDPHHHDPEAVRAVVRQLALQGVLADSRLADGTRALVLQVEELERYAGSLIVLARSHPRGIAAIDLAALFSPAAKLPRLGAATRLRRDQELVILDCVVQLLIEHGLCIRHEGLIIFPSLFNATEHDPVFPHAVALYYEFAGAVDNIYASLVTSLAVSQVFGPVRLWEDRAEFSRAGLGTVGVRKSQRGGSGARGVARLDVYFDEGATVPTRELFVGFVEDHLGEHGVEILEQLTMTCSCGCELPEKAVRARIEKGLADIACPACESRLPLTPGAAESRERSPDLESRIRALKTTILDQRKKTVVETKVSLHQIQRAHAAATSAPAPPIRILHLSDLHVPADADVSTLLQPLAADIEDRVDGLGFDRLDFCVVSGDVTNRAAPGELEKARELVSGIVARFGLTSERCIVVPGNHDLDWNEPVYGTVKRRAFDPKKLVPGRYKEQGDLYEVRDDALYPNRFRNFSQYFYHALFQQPFPLEPEQQCIPLLFPEVGLQFLALNSAWEIDEYFQDRSGIHPGALSRGLAEADRQVENARQEGRLAPSTAVLRIAAWHHPITGNEKIQDDAFVQNLQRAGVRLCMHGHVHEDRDDLFGYLHPTRSVRVVGAGSFGAPARERPESVPRLYNVVELWRDHSKIRVHTRCLRKQTGAWEGWAVWPGGEPGARRTFYEVAL